MTVNNHTIVSDHDCEYMHSIMIQYHRTTCRSSIYVPGLQRISPAISTHTMKGMVDLMSSKHVSYLQVSQFTILSAMLAGMDDREDPADLITMEAMSGLARIFEKIDEGHVRPILINIALRIRPCFEKVNNYSCVGSVCTLCRKEVLVSHDQYRNSSHNSSLEDMILRIEPSFCGSIYMLKIVRKLIPSVFSPNCTFVPCCNILGCSYMCIVPLHPPHSRPLQCEPLRSLGLAVCHGLAMVRVSSHF